MASHLLPHEDRHAICLKNIGRLESELFPDLPKELRWAEWPSGEWEDLGIGHLTPGQVWPVENANYVQVMGRHYPTNRADEMLQLMHAQGLSSSGAMAEAMTKH
jgi:hypothetical protein